MMGFKEYLMESNDGTDIVKVSVPFLIRILEWAKEEAKDDVEIHKLVENILKRKHAIFTKDYEAIIKELR